MKGTLIYMSYLPFLSFLISFAGLVLMFAGVVRIIAIRREFSMYFDKRDQLPPESAKQRGRKITISWILVASGIVLFILSYFI